VGERGAPGHVVGEERQAAGRRGGVGEPLLDRREARERRAERAPALRVVERERQRPVGQPREVADAGGGPCGNRGRADVPAG
jgi:hypothetical protein